MREERRIVPVMFSDIEGYSDITDDRLVLLLKQEITTFWKKVLTEENHIFFNTWGDAFFICSNDVSDLAEIALQLRDYFRNTHWKNLGFKSELSIRISLHVDNVVLVSDNGRIIDVIGQAVNAAARIEPVVKSNSVYCSFLAHQHLIQNQLLKYHFKSLGTVELVKGWGSLELYKLDRDYETFDEGNPGAAPAEKTKIKIPKKFSDKSFDDFLDASLDQIYEYFDEELKELAEEQSEISFKHIRIDRESFKTTIYINDDTEAQCGVWVDSAHFSRNISVVFGSTTIRGSYNESLSIKHDEYELFIEPLMGIPFGHTVKREMSKVEAAQYLWERLIQQISQ